MINLVDRDNAINDQIREMAYQLFERAEAALAPSADAFFKKWD